MTEIAIKWLENSKNRFTNGRKIYGFQQDNNIYKTRKLLSIFPHRINKRKIYHYQRKPNHDQHQPPVTPTPTKIKLPSQQSSLLDCCCCSRRRAVKSAIFNQPSRDFAAPGAKANLRAERRANERESHPRGLYITRASGRSFSKAREAV